MKSRVAHYRERLGLAARGNIHEVHMDEKWFYIRTNRSRRKFLARQPDESADAVPDESADAVPYRPPRRRTKSRRFRTKIMYLGVVGKPDPTHDFPGKVCLIRVAVSKTATAHSTTENFSPDIERNKGIVDGWRALVNDTMTASEIKDTIATAFSLDASKLALRYARVVHKRGGGTEEKPEFLKDGDRPNATRTHRAGTLLSIADLTLKIRRLPGEVYLEDCNCDGAWLAEKLENEVGPAIRAAYHWVPLETTIRLQMDNAGR